MAIARLTASCLTVLVALAGCANSVDEHVSKQRQVRRLEIMQPWGWLETRRDIELAMVECMRKSQLLEIGVATPADRPCKDDDWRINTTTTAAGMTTQYVYRDPDGSAAYLYFDADNKLVAKQWF